MRKVNILITGRSREEVQAAADMLDTYEQCRTEIRIITNGHVDPLHGVTRQPDLLLLCDIHGEEELRSVARTAPDKRPALVVFGPGDNTDSIRMAMRAGVRDYLTLPLNAGELRLIVEQIAVEIEREGTADSGSLHVFINGKGGSGATFLATNVAHGLAREAKVTLVDLDLQFAGLCRYLDLTPKRTLLEAVQAVDDMDEVSAEAYTAKHDSGLRLLAGRSDELILNHEVSADRVVTLLQAYQSFNDFVIVDLPRHIDELSAAVLESADRISIVMQQSFPHLHDTTRLLQIMRDELGISNSELTVIVNRYSKDSDILLKDIENALRVDDIVKMPNHYRVTSESINTGIPVTEVTQRASVARGLRELYQNIGGIESVADTGGLQRLQSLFRRQ